MKNFSLILVSSLLASCATTTTPNYDRRAGDALRSAKLAMTINPDAGKTAEAPDGLDGKAAKEAAGRYQNSFKAPPPAVNVINIGGSIAGGR